jgi:hypothetical protein
VYTPLSSFSNRKLVILRDSDHYELSAGKTCICCLAAAFGSTGKMCRSQNSNDVAVFPIYANGIRVYYLASFLLHAKQEAL